MKNTESIFGIIAASAISMAATADVTLTLDQFSATGSEFAQYLPGETLTGMLNTAYGDFTLTQQGENSTYCDDLTILIADESKTHLLMQIGGYSDYGAQRRYHWLDGANDNAGTHGGGTVHIGDIDVTGYYLFIGNGYGYGGIGVWTGTIELMGSVMYDDGGEGGVVPGPAVAAAFVAIGLARRRRRRD
ncbi:MAG: hypothetical protein VX527_04745 [Planctomycetota bacterium]|nr:hypothetical protein [Planctomycetota bacterium]